MSHKKIQITDGIPSSPTPLPQYFAISSPKPPIHRKFSRQYRQKVSWESQYERMNSLIGAFGMPIRPIPPFDDDYDIYMGFISPNASPYLFIPSPVKIYHASIWLSIYTPILGMPVDDISALWDSWCRWR